MTLYHIQKKEKEALQQQPEPAPAPSEAMVDTAPVISPSLTPPLEPEAAAAAEGEAADVSISPEELKELNQAVQGLMADQERTELEELKEDREEYIEASNIFRWGGTRLFFVVVVLLIYLFVCCC